MGIDHCLHVDLANAFDRADEVGVLTQQVAGVRRFDVLFGVTVTAGMLLQQTLGLLGEHAAFAGCLLVERSEPGTWVTE